MKKLVLFSALLFSIVLGYATCDSPQNVVTTEITSNSASFSWSASTSADYYAVYFRKYNEDQTSQIYGTQETNFTFTNLEAGERYVFYFSASCGQVISAPTIIVEETLLT